MPCHILQIDIKYILKTYIKERIRLISHCMSPCKSLGCLLYGLPANYCILCFEVSLPALGSLLWGLPASYCILCVKVSLQVTGFLLWGLPASHWVLCFEVSLPVHWVLCFEVFLAVTRFFVLSLPITEFCLIANPHILDNL